VGRSGIRSVRLTAVLRQCHAEYGRVQHAGQYHAACRVDRHLSASHLRALCAAHRRGAGIIRMGSLLRAAVETLDFKEIDVVFYDTDMPANQTFVARYHGIPANASISYSEAVNLPFSMAHRHYSLQCLPSHSFANSGFSSTPTLIAVLAACIVALNIFFLIAASVVFAAKRAMHVTNMLRQTNEAKGEALRILKQSQAISEQHNQSKSDFLAFLCHELRNPLHAVASLVDFLTHSESLLPHLDDEDASHLETIEQQVKLMGRIVDDALDLSKIEAGKMQIESVAFNVKKLCLSLASGYKTKGQTSVLTYTGLPQGQTYAVCVPTLSPAHRACLRVLAVLLFSLESRHCAARGCERSSAAHAVLRSHAPQTNHQQLAV